MLYSVNHLIAERVRDNPDFEILGIPDKNFNYAKYTFSDLDISASLLARYFVDNGTLPPRPRGDTTTRMTVGLLGHSSFDFVIAELALIRLGYCVLFISPNNSPPAIAHLLQVTQSSHILVQSSLLPSATATITFLEDSTSVKIIECPPSDTYGREARMAYPEKMHWDPILDWKDESEMPAFIIHSSGSTGFPKPIVMTHRAAIGNWRERFGMCSLSTLPLYHAQGHSNMYRAFFAIKPIYLFPTGSIPITSSNVLRSLSQASDVEALMGVPSALKLLAETDEGLKVLSSLKLVIFGGSACPDELGNSLVANGVPLVGRYGSTETGNLLSSLRDFDNDKEWNYLRVSGPYVKAGVKDFLRFEEVGKGTFELVVLNGLHTKVMSNRPDNSYATKDLFIKHPTIPDAYKCIGRIDDTLVMVNGEKTNPLPIELTLRNSPYISDAVVFGAERTQIGALILPTELAKDFSPAEMVRAIAPVVALANADSPSHSQLATETLVFLSFGTTMPRADKGSILRPKVYQQFEETINDVYKRLEGGSGSGAKLKLSDDELQCRRVLRESIGQTIDRSLDNLMDDTDLFEFGLDSLQTSRIRNALQRDIDLSGKRLSSNVVYEYPSIAKLSRHLLALSFGQAVAPESNNSHEIMMNLVKKYRHLLKSPTTSANDASDHLHVDRVVVLTGVTGSLGAYLLDELLADTSTKTIYCLCRAENDEDAAARVAASMRTRKLEARYLENIDRVIALASDLSAEKLGLMDSMYEEIATRLTCVIHNAWAVNFNLDISSFESNIRGAVHLMNLALHGYLASFYFVSSVSAVALWQGPYPVPEIVMEDMAVAQTIGYAQSKWVTEKLCQIAAQSTMLRTGILRIGQMVGDTKNGIWNETEAISLIIKCADTIGVLPDLDESLSWLPVDYAAKTIGELIKLALPEDQVLVWHILHPHSITWQDIHASLRLAGLSFKLAHRKDWLKALQASSTDEVVNPSRKLLTFYENKYGANDLPVRSSLSMEKTLAASKVLSATPLVDDVFVGKWIGAWKKSCFLL